MKFINLKGLKRVGKSARVRSKKLVEQISKRPLTSFVISLAILLGLIVLSNFLFRPKAPPTEEAPPKEVQTYKIGEAPRITVQAQVEKSGVIQIVAQAPGIVSSIGANEGQQLKKGANLINLASNYQGANAAGVQTAIASRQYQFARDTFDAQKEIIAKQREIAEKTKENTNELREISEKSIDETKSLIDLNQGILNELDSNISALEAGNVGGANDAAILQSKQLKSQFLSAQNQLKSAQRNLEYQTDEDNPPTQLANLSRDLTLRQLDIQEKSLSLNLEISRLQLALSAINASLFHPTAPFPGTVQRVFVKVGQAINPGTPLLTFAGSDSQLTVIARVPQDIAAKISKLETSKIYLGTRTVEGSPAFISTEATDGQLYSIIYDISEVSLDSVTDGSFINIDIPVGYPDTLQTLPFVPIDSIFQTQEENIVYVVTNDKAASRRIKLGSVVGKYVEVTAGLESGDQIILNRNIIEGDKIKVVE